MTRIIEEVDFQMSGDAWANFTPSAHQDLNLSSMIDDFIARGGRIVEVPAGRSAERLDIPLPDSHSPLFSVENQRDYHQRKHHQKIHKQMTTDQALVEGIDRMLDTAITGQEIYHSLRCCSETFQRLLTLYFSKDPRAARFMLRDRETREGDLRKNVAAALAQGLIGVANIAAYCGISPKRLAKRDTQLCLNIPRGKTGRIKHEKSESV